MRDGWDFVRGNAGDKETVCWYLPCRNTASDSLPFALAVASQSAKKSEALGLGPTTSIETTGTVLDDIGDVLKFDRNCGSFTAGVGDTVASRILRRPTLSFRDGRFAPGSDERRVGTGRLYLA